MKKKIMLLSADNLKKVQYIERDYCEINEMAVEQCEKSWRLIANVNDHESNTGSYDVAYCEKCKLGFTNPYPTEDSAKYLYESKSSSDFDLSKGTPIDKVKDFFAKKLLRKISPYAKSDDVKFILDFGAGNCRFTLMASEVYKQAVVHAVDFQEAAPNSLMEAKNNNVLYKNIGEFEKESSKYDLIILRHVLEHNHHPISLLKMLSQRLSERGVLYIEVPNLESGLAKLIPKYWKGFYVPRHIHHYTIESLKSIVNEAGLNSIIGRNEMPLTGNILATVFKAKNYNTFWQIIGILSYPIQFLIEKLYRSSTCINSICNIKHL